MASWWWNLLTGGRDDDPGGWKPPTPEQRLDELDYEHQALVDRVHAAAETIDDLRYRVDRLEDQLSDVRQRLRELEEAQD